MGGAVSYNSLKQRSIPESKLNAKMVEVIKTRAAAGGTTSMRSFDSIILKFPKIDESLRECKSIFERFDVDNNGAIDPQELRGCFRDLEIDFTEEETNDLFAACDINEHMEIKFNEFVVLLCLVYLFQGSSTRADKARAGLPKLEATFETLINAFVFLDKNKDGYVSKNEMVEAVKEETTEGRNNAGNIAMERFEEMDWDKNGLVTFKEFLFTITRWIGMDDQEDED